jgi:hypothetical protein
MSLAIKVVAVAAWLFQLYIELCLAVVNVIGLKLLTASKMAQTGLVFDVPGAARLRYRNNWFWNGLWCMILYYFQ